jgi:glycosyltransferase involved in cell wall biosynthesis
LIPRRSFGATEVLVRIAQVAPLFESVPPKLYGGTERVVSYLTEELVAMGHDVTLFASGDSQTSARLISACDRAMRLDRARIDRMSGHVLMIEELLKRRDEFDVVHSHIDFLHFPHFRRLSVPSLTTLHGRLDLPELRPFFQEFSEAPLVSISDAQRKPLPSANWQATVYHGLPPELFKSKRNPGQYLAFLGRLSLEKRVDRAIEIARRVGMKLKVAAKVDPQDQDYFHTVAQPMLQDPCVEFIGEIGEHEKQEFLSNAYALLFPIDWPEPFGMVMIEAFACGTPVIAYDCGSVREVVGDGVTGYVVNSVDEAVKAVHRIPELSREQIRAVFERRFSARQMAENYLSVYERLTRLPAITPFLPHSAAMLSGL